uniref:NADH:ubiquinone reductase (H(+)-translocating) n=1 Tax=Schistosoma haematobium TaxID=6185 RepID=Q1I0N2_SCHHA|nr:NADH dehydrogenase subunit 5 [Schistosoma haematobium]AAZ57319.1 NADH dehydrogenase subunit 5 [Schistosoma haematobium]QDO72027.1 NADH dehydrogenase subunit 5 [Schistosoma haematobium]QDO72134.1 NADH dehydrogenase subunit 5 [Schistosoma haematobium]QRW36467.1 NADH dehydrogenase subunit 5 [Schistosoma haematobium]QRW36479.1 NADH dehydrogenase subunit 5 [Schistosoma haematobium]
MGFFILLFVILVLLLDNIGGVVSLSLGNVCNLIDGFMFHYIDLYSSKLVLMLFSCSILCLSYVFHYMGNSWNLSVQLVSVLILFSWIMVGLVSSCNFITTLVFWEYLGLVSFILILYYGVWESYRGGVVTLVSSRFGDVGLFIILGYSISMGGGLSFVTLTLMIWLIVITKSASFPFISWLLEAMRAPTPVSSLVHSSTLVAAGVWFYLNYYEVIGLSAYNLNWGIDLLLVSGLISIIISGISALVCNDLKQIIALSTCNNISWVLVMMVMGSVDLALIQLVIHGLSKCVIFFLVGDYISSSSGGQMVNALMVSIIGSLRDFVYVFLLILGLSGFPFIGLYFSKHLFLSVFYSISFYNLVMMFMLYMCAVLSIVYCIRLIMLFDGVNVNNVSSIRLFYYISSVVILFSWVLNVYYCYNIVFYDYSVLKFSSSLVLLLLLLGLIVGVYFGLNLLIINWFSRLMGLDIIVMIVEWLMVSLAGLWGLFQFRWEISILKVLSELTGLLMFRCYTSIILLSLSIMTILIVII